jgi:hypothetical protein
MYEEDGEHCSLVDGHTRLPGDDVPAGRRAPQDGRPEGRPARREAHSLCLQRAGRQLLDSGWELEVFSRGSPDDPSADPLGNRSCEQPAVIGRRARGPDADPLELMIKSRADRRP